MLTLVAILISLSLQTSNFVPILCEVAMTTNLTLTLFWRPHYLKEPELYDVVWLRLAVKQ